MDWEAEFRDICYFLWQGPGGMDNYAKVLIYDR